MDHLDILQWNKFSTLRKSIHEVFGAKAREQPGAVGVDVNEGSTIWGELEIMSDALAYELQRTGVLYGKQSTFVFEKSL